MINLLNVLFFSYFSFLPLIANGVSMKVNQLSNSRISKSHGFMVCTIKFTIITSSFFADIMTGKHELY